MNAHEAIVKSGLNVARRVCDGVGECAPTLFVVRSGRTDWSYPITLATPSDYVRVAARLGAPAVVIIGSHLLVDPQHTESRLIRVYAALMNANGEVVIVGKQQRWHKSKDWTQPRMIEGVRGAAGWSM